eukprot:COSAG02_NODE_334_length_24367_cov_6.715634_6_plen_97_part_00
MILSSDSEFSRIRNCSIEFTRNSSTVATYAHIVVNTVSHILSLASTGQYIVRHSINSLDFLATSFRVVFSECELIEELALGQQIQKTNFRQMQNRN